MIQKKAEIDYDKKMSTPTDSNPNNLVTEDEIENQGVVNGTYGRLSPRSKAQISGFVVFSILWSLLGFAAFVASLVCIGKEGDNSYKIGGVVMALFLGPFYWIYFGVLRGKKKYCMPALPKVATA